MPRARAASYEPGAWLAVSGERIWLLAALDPSSPTALSCHEAVVSGAEPSALLGLLVADGTARPAGFAIVGADGDDTRLILGGAAVAEIDTAHGERSRVSGLDAPTWVEQQVSGVTRIRLTGGERLGGAVVALPLAAGMAFASALTITAGGTVAAPPPVLPPSPPPIPAPIPQPEPTPSAEPTLIGAPAPAEEPPPVGEPPAEEPRPTLVEPTPPAAVVEPTPPAAVVEPTPPAAVVEPTPPVPVAGPVAAPDAALAADEPPAEEPLAMPEVADLNAGTRASATAPAPPDSSVPTPPPPAPAVVEPPRPDGLIDSVPWSIPGAPPAGPPAGPPVDEPPRETAPPSSGTAPGNPLGWVSAAPMSPSDTMYPPPRDPQPEPSGPPPGPPNQGPPNQGPPNQGLPNQGPPNQGPPDAPPPTVAPPSYAQQPQPQYGPPTAAYPGPEAYPPGPPPGPPPPQQQQQQQPPPAPQPAAAPGARVPDGPEQTVLAVVCPYGHLSPPYVGACRVCNTPIAAQEPFQTPRPVLGILNLSTGDMVTLDRDVILGRAPAAPPGDPNRRPHVVRLSSPGNDISRTHVEVRLDGWHVLVTDLGSTNGTVATLPGQPPLRLRAHDALAVVPGTIVSIADEVSFRYEVPA